MDYSLISFKILGDERGYLVALEGNDSIPFDISSIRYINSSDGGKIPGSCARNQLQQAVICISGSCDFILDNGKKRHIVHLDNPAQALYTSNNLWCEISNLSSDGVIMILADKLYNNDDYIHDYNEFMDTVASQKNI